MLVYPLLDAIVTSWATNTVEGSDFLRGNVTNDVDGTEGRVVPLFVWQRISAAFLVGTVLSVAYPMWLYRRRGNTEQNAGDKQGLKAPGSHP
eukprot:COSAG02_NODE_4375_length_5437_cov_7.337580_3_plen_92_part_00